MSRFSPFFTLTLLTAAVLNSSGCSNGTKTKDDGDQKAFIKEPQTDFGKVMIGQTVSHTFAIRNNGQTALTLGATRRIKARIAYEGNCVFSSREIPPGETAQVKVTFRPLGLTPKTYLAMAIKTDTGEELRIGGRIAVEDVIVLGPPLELRTWWRFEVGEDGEPKEFRGTVHSLSNVKIAAVESDNPFIKATLSPLSQKELDSLKAKSGSAIHIRAEGLTTVGRLSGTLTVKTIGRQPVTTKSIRIVGIRRGPLLRVDVRNGRWYPRPYIVDFGSFPAPGGKTVVVQLVLAAPKSGAEFRWDRANSDAPFLRTTIRKLKRSTESRQWAELTLRVPPNQPPVIRNTDNPINVRIFTNHPKAKEIHFLVHMNSF